MGEASGVAQGAAFKMKYRIEVSMRVALWAPTLFVSLSLLGSKALGSNGCQ
jgi:hypothetical protein